MSLFNCPRQFIYSLNLSQLSKHFSYNVFWLIFFPWIHHGLLTKDSATQWALGSFSRPNVVFYRTRRKPHIIPFLAGPKLEQPEINYSCLEQEVGPDNFQRSLPSCMNLYSLYGLLDTYAIYLYVLYLLSINNTCFKHRRDIVKPLMGKIST